jgi:membrane associated rhomboid family serine protease
VLLLSSRTGNGWGVVVAVALINGVLLWVFGRSSIHVGASGLVFGLIAFLIVSGVMEKRLVTLAIAILVGLLFGGTLVSGVIPRMGSYVSWDGHLAGAIAGALLAYAMTSYQKSARAFH